MIKIAVIGTGYVGLVSGVCFAETGVDVICVDINESKVSMLNSGNVPIYEPTLDTLMHRNQRDGRIKFTTDLAHAVRESEIIFLALPTPENEDGSADLSYVLNMAHTLSSLIDEYKIVVNKSTVPVGTADQMSEIFKQKCKATVDVVSNPEFLREGYAVEDFLKPDRIVIGSSSPHAIEKIQRLYSPFVRQGNPILIMDEKSAELTKYAANSFLALKISFMNEMAILAEKVGADIGHVRRGIGSDSRIGSKFLFPGIGFGGGCFPKDVKALQNVANKSNFDFKILNSLIDVNDRQRRLFLEKITQKIDPKGKKIALWGLSFKPNTDDIREAPSLYLIEQLSNLGASLSVYDPEAMPNTQRKIGDRVHFASNMYDALDQADALVIVTEWNAFRQPNFDEITKRMNQKLIFDGRNLFEPEDMKKLKFNYISIGRQEVING